MNRAILTFALFLNLFFVLQAQEEFFNAPDFKQIAVNIKEASSPYYYPNLMKKYLSGETMGYEEGRHLYFGFVYQEQYVPSDTSSYNQMLASVLNDPSFSEEDYHKVIRYSDALLLEDPFNLRALKAKLWVYARQDNVDAYQRTARMMTVVHNAITGTGDGASEKTPFYVIKKSHEFDILSHLGYVYGGEDKLLKNKKVNYLSLGDNRFGVERVYFNIEPAMNYLNKKGGGKI